MAKVSLRTRRIPRKKKPVPQVSSNGHLHGKPNGQGTAQRVGEAIRLGGCSSVREFFRVARCTFPDHAPEQCVTTDDQRSWMERELSWFESLGSGNPVPRGYKIPECVRLLADRVLESKSRRKCFGELSLLNERRLMRASFSSGPAEAVQTS